MLIVGGGFWGQAVARLLRERGRETLVLDDGAEWGASRAAGGLVYPDEIGAKAFLTRYAPDWWTPRHTAASRKFLGSKPTGEHTFNNRSTGYRYKPGLHLVEPGSLLTGLPVLRGRVLHLQRAVDGWTVSHTGGTHRARNLIVAAGIATGAVLQTAGIRIPPVEGLPGRARLIEVGKPWTGTPVSYSTRLPGRTRTSKFFLRPWGDGTIRLGDTLEPDLLQDQLLCLERLLLREFPQGGQEAGWMKGVRPVTPRFFVELVDRGLVAATGGHRVGMAAAGGAALRASELLE